MDALGINLPGLITQIVSFLVLLAILYKFLYKPLLRMLDQRSARIKDSLETAQRVKEDAAQTKEEMRNQFEVTQAEGQAMISQAREVADRFREEELAKARHDIEMEWMKAEANIQRERDASIEKLRSEFAGLAMKAAERVIGKSLDESVHRDIIEDVLTKSAKIGRV